jgi:hypothetical protein
MIQGQSNETCARSDVVFNSNSQVPLFGGDQENDQAIRRFSLQKKKNMAELEQFCILARTQKGRACGALIQQVVFFVQKSVGF